MAWLEVKAGWFQYRNTAEELLVLAYTLCGGGGGGTSRSLTAEQHRIEIVIFQASLATTLTDEIWTHRHIRGC